MKGAKYIEMVMGFGKYKGLPLSKVPTDYLEWVCRTAAAEENFFVGLQQITDELKKRNNNRPKTTLEISEHGLERANLRLRSIYLQKRREKEKLKQWLTRVFQYVLKNGQMRRSYSSRYGLKFKQPRYEYFLEDSIRGISWKFVTEGNDSYQKLVTVFAPGYTDSGKKKA